MPFFSGGTLYQQIRRGPPPVRRQRMSFERVQFYAAQLVLALSHLHSCSIVYRDLKPDNVMIDEDGFIALVDFGLSKTNVSEQRGAKTMAGSPGYTAPELLKPREERRYGTSIDWWCLGVLIFELIYGHRPFHHPTRTMLYKLIASKPLSFPQNNGKLREDQVIVSQQIISAFLIKDPTLRLGAYGTQEIMSHPFFTGMDWSLLLKKQRSVPYTPLPFPALPTISSRKGKVTTLLEMEKSHDNNRFQKWKESVKEWWNPQSSTTPIAVVKHKTRSRKSGKLRTFDEFSFVEDASASFLVDEDELLDAALEGRDSTQRNSFSSIRTA